MRKHIDTVHARLKT